MQNDIAFLCGFAHGLWGSERALPAPVADVVARLMHPPIMVGKLPAAQKEGMCATEALLRTHEEVEELRDEAETKTRKPWSDEAKAAARERAIAMGFGKKERAETPPEKLSRDHREYVGVREDYTLVETDWGDIKTMRKNGLPEARIAGSYQVGVDYLRRFVTKMEAVDKASSGNF